MSEGSHGEGSGGEPPAPQAEARAEDAAPVFAGPDALLRFADALVADAGATKPPAPAAELHLISFLLDREKFAIPITRAVEILRAADVITRVPGAPPHIRGVTNVRGRILPVVELRTRLSLAPAEITQRSRILLVEAHGRVIGVLVDTVAEVLKIPVTSVLDPPEEIRSLVTDYVQGIARQDGQLIILLDLDRALLIPSTALPGAPEKTP